MQYLDWDQKYWRESRMATQLTNFFLKINLKCSRPSTPKIDLRY